MPAQFKVTTKIGAGDRPLLVMKLQIQHELVLDGERLKMLRSAVQAQQESNESLPQKDYGSLDR